MKEPSVFKGSLEGWYETGSEGTYWVLQELGKSWEGMHFLKTGDHLKIVYQASPKTEEISLWEGVLQFISTVEAKNHPYFKLYVRAFSTGLGEQLILNNRWVHLLPVNVDLALWAQVFFEESPKITGVLTKCGC